MKLTDEQRTHLKDSFQKMKSKDDLLDLLNIAKPIIYGPNTVPIPLRVLTYYSNPKVNPDRYTHFRIKKKSGGERVIHAPVKGLKSLQKVLNLIFGVIFEPHKSAFGFAQGKSIVENGREHAGSYYVYNIDLRDFFPSIDQARVWKCFHLPPFNLNPEGERQELANMLAGLCCTEMEVDRLSDDGVWQKVKRNVLPQGAPTSPTLTNVVCQRLDHLLTGVAKRFGLKYSRYADDITFSSMHNVYQKDGEFLQELRRIIHDQGFHIKETKVRLQKRGYRQMVTGLVVNDKVNVQKRYIKELRMWLYLWDRYGFERTNGFFLNDYFKNKRNSNKVGAGMIRVIRGKIDYLKMVMGETENQYQRLKYDFDRLNKDLPMESKLIDDDTILEALFEKGLDHAMDLFTRKSD